MQSYDFTMRLLEEKGCAVAPGIAFDTGYMNQDRVARSEELSVLDSFVRVSLANSNENVAAGINLICDFLDEQQQQRKSS
jgi:aspartate/methionine/tyrosine aminotransferase